MSLERARISGKDVGAGEADGAGGTRAGRVGGRESVGARGSRTLKQSRERFTKLRQTAFDNAPHDLVINCRVAMDEDISEGHDP